MGRQPLATSAPQPLALTMGEPAGIGGEIAVAAWRALSMRGTLRFFAIDDPDRLAALGAPVETIAKPEDADAGLFTRALPVLPQRLRVRPTPGRPSPETAEATIASIERGTRLALEGRVGGVVTNPISKAALYNAVDFAHPGHTEFIAALTGAPRPVMLLAGDLLRVAPLTIHIPLAEVPAAVTETLIIETVRVLDAALKQDFALPAPRIAVSGLNPHAGEGGAMGRDEIDVVEPAIRRLQAEGVDVRGPSPADTLFHAAARARYDAVLTMYHDQGLIPIKTLEFDRGVNVTLGLPIVRTSPDHGVAYDIAGTGRARPDSLIAALERAWEIAANRRMAAARA